MVMIEFHWWYVVIALILLAVFFLYKLQKGDMYDGILWIPAFIGTIAAAMFFTAGHYLLPDSGEKKCPPYQTTSKP